MWSSSRALQFPLDTKIKSARELPYTISYVLRKRQQIESLMELPKEKRPPDEILWHPKQKKLDEWLDSVLYSRTKKDKGNELLNIPINMIEG